MGLPLELGDAGPNLPEPVRSAGGCKHNCATFDRETETGF